MFGIKKKEKNRVLFSADYVYVNGTHKRKYGVLTENGRIIETGKREIIREQFPFTKEVKFDGALYPGFIDSHIHLNMLAKTFEGTDARNFATTNEIKKVASSIDGEEVHIFNFDFNKATENEWELLFNNTNTPLIVISSDEHTVFVNRALLNKYEIAVKEYEGGVVAKRNGKFIGILKDRAIENVRFIIDKPASDESIRKAINYLLSMGITGITNFDYEIFDKLEKADKNKELKIRTFQGIKCKLLDDAIKNSVKTGQGGTFFRIGPVKCFLDGSLGSQTALMNEKVPFNGMQTLTEEEFQQIVKKANGNGLQVAVHAIGSKAVDMALNAFSKSGKPEMRNRIEHMQFISEDDLSLIENTEFIASMQPAHYKYDKNLLQKYGLEDYPHAYDWAFLLSMNKTVAFGSDAPVVPPNVPEGIYTAIFRENEKNITLKDAVRCYTENGARANFFEKEGGRIIRNMNADFTLLNKPLTEDFDSERIKTIATIIKGEAVWKK